VEALKIVHRTKILAVELLKNLINLIGMGEVKKTAMYAHGGRGKGTGNGAMFQIQSWCGNVHEGRCNHFRRERALKFSIGDVV
jgi:hypothetical protein